MNRKHGRITLGFAAAVLLAGCSSDLGAPMAPGTAIAVTSRSAALEDGGPPLYSEWSDPVNVGAPVNSMSWEQAPALSRDGLTILFHCGDCPGNLGGTDIWVSQRTARDASWGARQNVAALNTTFADGGASLTVDGHRLYFQSARLGGFGSNDIYVARRHDKRNALAWFEPVNVGPGVNSSANEAAAQPFEDEAGRKFLYFQSNRPGGLGGNDLYVSMMGSDGVFGPAQPVSELNSAYDDQTITFRRDGLEVFFGSNRPGGQGQLDVWTATRASTSDPWSAPVNLGPVINGPFVDAGVELSFDGTELYYHSPFRPGEFYPQFEILVSTRQKLR